MITTLNGYLAQGTNANRLAYTPNPTAPASGPNPNVIFQETDTGNLYYWNFLTAAWVQVSAGGGGGGTALVVSAKSADYTLVIGDAGALIFHPASDATNRTWTIPANASVAFAIGTPVTFDNQSGAGAVTIAITSDTLEMVGTGLTGSRTLASGGRATAIKVTSTLWRIEGSGLS